MIDIFDNNKASDININVLKLCSNLIEVYRRQTVVPEDLNKNAYFLYSRIPISIRDSIFLSQCDETEMIDIIKEFDNNKASDININVLKSCLKFVLGHLVNFFNKFLDMGIFPTILKSGMITPILKKGDSRYFDIYRPVSTPVFGKILEKLM